MLGGKFARAASFFVRTECDTRSMGRFESGTWQRFKIGNIGRLMNTKARQRRMNNETLVFDTNLSVWLALDSPLLIRPQQHLHAINDTLSSSLFPRLRPPIAGRRTSSSPL